jgi:hypothetical protein
VIQALDPAPTDRGGDAVITNNASMPARHQLSISSMLIGLSGHSSDAATA